MIPKNQFTSQPQFPVEIDQSKPFARGLIRCGLSWSKRDLVTDALLTQSDLIPSIRNTSARKGGTSSPFTYAATDVVDFVNLTEYTIITAFVPKANAAGQNNGIFRTGATSAGLEIFLFSTTNYPLIRVNGGDILAPTTGPTIPTDTLLVAGARVVEGTSGTADVWWAGEQKHSSTFNRSFSADDLYNIGYQSSVSTGNVREIQAYWFWDRKLSDAEMAAVTQNPWQIFRPAQSTKQFYSAPSVAITGTLNVTEADDTLAATGALAIAGSLNVTEEGDSLSSTGTLPITGSLAVTEEDDALTSTGALAISGSLSVTEDDDTLASSGTSGATGSLNVTEEGDTLTATATVTQLVGGGGMGKQKRQRGWANERARLEASLQTETAAQEVKTATKILRASDSESARRVADLVREYESARATLEQLRDEVERLRVETDRSERLRDELETAAKVVEIFAQEEAELLEILDIIDEMESRALLIALGIAA